MQNRSTRHRPKNRTCVIPDCRALRAGLSDQLEGLPLCWGHISRAHKVEEIARRERLRKHYTELASKEGKKPEEMFWAPDVFESQWAESLQRESDNRRDLAHYRALVASGAIKPSAPHRERAEQPQATEQDGVVYYLRVGSFIKIGWTHNIDKRMRSYPPDSILLATEPGTRKHEHKRHKMFATHRTHGREWYAMTPSLMHHIEQMAAEYGSPDPVTFAAKPVTIPRPRAVQPVKLRGWTGRAS